MEDQSSNYFYKQKTISNRIFKRNPFIVENLDKDIFTSDFNKESKEADEMFTFGSMWKVEHKIFKKCLYRFQDTSNILIGSIIDIVEYIIQQNCAKMCKHASLYAC